MSVAGWLSCLASIGLLFAVSGTAADAADGEKVVLAYERALLSENLAALPALEDALVKSIDVDFDEARAENTRRMLATRVLVEKTPLSTESSSRVLCQVKTFTLEQQEMEADLRARLYRLLVRTLEADDFGAARSFDCALNNFENGYFDYSRSLTAFFGDMVEMSPDEIREKIKQLTAEGDELRRNLTPYRESYYLVRLDQRMAALAAAQAVSNARLAAAEGRPAKQEIVSALGNAVERLKKSLDLDTLARARNGWRLYADLKFHKMFYQAASEAPDPKRLEALRAAGAAFSPALKMEGFEDAIEPEARRVIERDAPDYIDPVYVDRLFPGASDTAEDDSKAWRKQAFSPASFADLAATCLENGPITDLASLQALDKCMATLENDDWWVQLGAYANNAQAQQEAEQLASEVRRRSSEADFNDRNVTLTVVQPDRLSALYRVRTDMGLTRTEAEIFRRLVAKFDSRRDMLVGRSKQY